jgi:hypothetical protein
MQRCCSGSGCAHTRALTRHCRHRPAAAPGQPAAEASRGPEEPVEGLAAGPAAHPQDSVHLPQPTPFLHSR